MERRGDEGWRARGDEADDGVEVDGWVTGAGRRGSLSLNRDGDMVSKSSLRKRAKERDAQDLQAFGSLS